MNTALSTHKPHVTVIVPNYNHARYLGQRINSILTQTYKDFEVILLDDASTDESREVLTRYRGLPNVRLIFNQRNSGSTFIQWNRGVREAQGEYVWIAESDDYADPRFLERMVACLDAHPDVGLAYCQSCVVDEEGVNHGSLIAYYDDVDVLRWRSDFVADGQQECARYLVVKNTIPNASAVLMRRRAYLEAGGADDTMRLAGDWLQWAKILMITKMAFIAEVLNFYRSHTGTVRTSYLETPRALKEFLITTAYIRHHVRIPDEVRRRVNEQWFHMWRRLSSSESGISFSDHILLWRWAICADPALARRRAWAQFRYGVYCLKNIIGFKKITL
jgi:glycosyltransferase involved in cell wall biosynthesis